MIHSFSSRLMDSYLSVSILLLWGMITVSSCQKDPSPEPRPSADYTMPGGVFVLNEGNFRMANGSITYFHSGKGILIHDIFRKANNRPTGDVIQDMKVINGEAWIVANNSGRIETARLDSFVSTATITGITSPRWLLQISPEKAYASDLYSTDIHILSLKNKEVSGRINTGKPAEALAMVDGKVFALHWSSLGGYNNNSLAVIDPLRDSVTEILVLRKEPNSMAVDHQGNLWVLCSGGFLFEETPALYCIDPKNLEIIRVMEFHSPGAYPTRLCTNPGRDTLYYLNRDVYRLVPSDTKLTDEVLIPAEGRLFYGLGAGPQGIFVSDALDYQQNGLVYVYDAKGNLLNSFTAGIIPGGFVFL